MLELDDSRKLDALRELLNPRVVAAWLDEVEEHRANRSSDVSSAKATTASEGPERLLTVKEICERLQVGRSWLYESTHWTGFPVIRVGRSLRFRLSEVEAWLIEHGSE